MSTNGYILTHRSCTHPHRTESLDDFVGMTTHGTRMMLSGSNLPPHFWVEAMMTFMYLCNRMPMSANDGITTCECFYRTKPVMGHISTFGCIVRLVV